MPDFVEIENCTFETLEQFNESAAERRGYLHGLEDAAKRFERTPSASLTGDEIAAEIRCFAKRTSQ